MTDISVIMPTAREKYSILGQPHLNYLEPTMKSLARQTFKDFEFILVDALYDERKEDFSKLPFPIKHVPVHPNHRFWLDRKRWSVCASLNTALLHSEGELLVRIDDASQFDEGFLERFWEGYQSGVWPLAMHTRYRGGKQAYYTEEYKQGGYEFTRVKAHGEPSDTEKNLNRVFKEGDPVRDTRWSVVERAGGRMIAPVDWMYGYSSFTLEAALKVNGFDELFDESKSLEDVDFGSRLEMAGYGGKFLLDVNHTVIEHEHEPIPESLIERDVKPIKCNYAVYLLNRRKRRWRANSDSLSEEDLRFIREVSLRPPCSPHPDFYDGGCEGEMWSLWVENQPFFNLREEMLSI